MVAGSIPAATPLGMTVNTVPTDDGPGCFFVRIKLNELQVRVT